MKYAQVNANCWRDCENSNTDHTHVFYTCERIQPYWKKVIWLIKQILRIEITIQQHDIVLGIQPQTLRQEHLYLFWVLRITTTAEVAKP